ncbi:MAG TPA: F0F1 ATP synthase subunit delta [Jatrophihabitans sp.]|nr:F0F1 ATP synthase subunit delta [Jatrophihabitans sp.]
MIHSASRASLAELQRRLEAVTGRFSTSDGLIGLAREVHSVAQLLAAQPRLRRALSDSSTQTERRTGLADRLLDGKVSASALQVVDDAVSLRWSSQWDLVEALELVAADALFAAAEDAGVLDRIEDELFRFERVLDGTSELGVLLDEATVAPQRRIQLLDALVAQKVHPITAELLRQAISSRRKRTLRLAIDELLVGAAKRRNRSVAKVVSAVELSTVQQDRLTTALTELYHRPISVRIAIDPAVRGGLVVRIGDEIIDGSVAARMLQARNALAGRTT